MGLPKVQAYIKTTDNICYKWKCLLGTRLEIWGLSNTVRKICYLAFPFFFQRKKERMTLSAIHPDGGENFRLYMGLLQHHSFSFFFNFNKKWMIAGVQE